MKKAILIFLPLLIFGMVEICGATVLTFDDIGSSDYGLISNEYGGFIWSGFGYLSEDKYVGSGFDNGTITPDYTAYNYRYYTTTWITSSDGTTFDFDGVYLTSGWYDDNEITVSGYCDGELIYTSTIILSTDATWFDFNFYGVDSVSFSSAASLAYAYFAMDNFTYNEINESSASAPVPEPATMVLFGTGLIGLASFTRRKKKKLIH